MPGRHLIRRGFALAVVSLIAFVVSDGVAFTAAATGTKARGKAVRRTRRHPRTVSSGGVGFEAPVSVAPTSVPTTTSVTGALTSGPTVSGPTAKIVNGVAYAPASAPVQVQRAIWAGDAIRLKPYVYGGGHARWNDVGYDCSGSVSYILHAAGLIKTSMDSSDFMSWGLAGAGQWITVYTNPGHAFVELAGIRLDTSAEGDPHPAPGSGPRWRPLLQATGGFLARHPSGL